MRGVKIVSTSETVDEMDRTTLKDNDGKKFQENSPLYSRMSWTMHFLIFLYACAFWIQVGAFPFLSKKLGVNTVLFGYLETASAVAMLLGGPLFGRFGDLFGAKAALMVAFISSLMFYFFLTIADSVVYLLLSRLCSFMMHAMHGAQMVMTDVSGNKDRAEALGRLSLAYGLGMIVGPTLGGIVTEKFSEQYATGVAAGLMVLSLVIVMVVVPRTTKDPQKLATSRVSSAIGHKQGKEGSVFDIQAIMSLLAIPEVCYVVVVKTIVGIPAGVFHSMFSIVNVERFSLTPQTNGYLLTYIGVLTALMQGFGVGWFTRRFMDTKILKFSLAAMALSYLLLAGANSLVLLTIIFVPMVMSGSLMNTISSSIMTKKVPETATGTSLGLSMATHSLIRTVSPTVGGHLYSQFGYPSFGLLGFLFNGGATLLVFMYHPPGL